MKKTPIVIMALFTFALGAVSAVAADTNAFEWTVKDALAPLANKEVADLKVVHLSADVQTWIDTSIKLKTGDRFTLVMNGRSWLSKTRNVSLPTSLLVMSRVGADGTVLRNTRDTNTIESPSDGNLFLSHSTVRILDQPGSGLNLDEGGTITVAVIRWSADADVPAILARLAKGKDAPQWAAAELARLQNPPQPPEGWAYALVPGEMFHVFEKHGDGGPAKRMELRTQGDTALLRKEVVRDLTSQSRIAWKWKVDALPSKVAENSLWTHDYISIAVVFDNGKDITYIWSAALPKEDIFQCPFPGWINRETHIVVRSGTEGFGTWLAEERNVFEDYERAVGGPAPKHITSIWLIGVSFISRKEGLASFGDIELRDEISTARLF